jgi:hypothetical protein
VTVDVKLGGAKRPKLAKRLKPAKLVSAWQIFFCRAL